MTSLIARLRDCIEQNERAAPNEPWLPLMREALAEIERAEWIPVSERHPPSHQVVLVHGGIAFYREQSDEWFTLTGERYPGKPIQWNVTHWRILPEPPALSAKEKP